MTVIIVALITAASAIIVGLISVLASRVETRDTRSRLLKDIEIASKLSQSSTARKALDDHIAESVDRLIEREFLDVERRRVNRPLVIAFVPLLITVVLDLTRHHTPAEWDRLRAILIPCFVVYALLFEAIASMRAFQYGRKKERRRAARKSA
ncbi:hypothetical protein [Mycobacterium marseillense]|uniref:hypothetical protein n=1 Tax=Mycobacterium marseillense TaxID=701042 RepID=UPI0011A75714|nr:hypothetical protein [Mycobacterium marseillense]